MRRPPPSGMVRNLILMIRQERQTISTGRMIKFFAGQCQLRMTWQNRARIGFARFCRFAPTKALSGSARDRESRAHASFSSDSPRCPKPGERMVEQKGFEPFGDPRKSKDSGR